MTLNELIQSIHALETRLQLFEEKYELRSEDFYRLVQEGKLEQSADFIEWLGLYEIKLKREQEYAQLKAELLSEAAKVAAPDDKLELPLAKAIP
jgi:ribosomal protein S16